MSRRRRGSPDGRQRLLEAQPTMYGGLPTVDCDTPVSLGLVGVVVVLIDADRGLSLVEVTTKAREVAGVGVPQRSVRRHLARLRAEDAILVRSVPDPAGGWPGTIERFSWSADASEVLVTRLHGAAIALGIAWPSP